ncbi:hypothetical protein ACFQWB_13635 [Paenibacillus thermoaerophilus]|uniref:Uncharacterized protein n=1 Tax=Paenibacillus thermoaerophilus TaxID=1215385 RepID=A0ABW2V4B6_9BACL|nr:hypothetical protein [Paenibacillus thermoaerophilus]TMV16134.1 hypothetical protein FE781_08685 [Paenibacillus thermoaerophilus]
MRRRPLTIAFAALAVLLCLANYLRLDPDNIYLFMFSVPVWIIETFSDIHTVNAYLLYALTIASWALIGWIGDRFLWQDRRKTPSP